MKSILCFIASGLLVATCSAQVLLSDSFSYPDGSLVGAPGSPWITASGGAGEQTIASGQLILDDNKSEDTIAPLSSAVTSGVITASFDFTNPTADIPSSAAANSLYFAAFATASVAPSTTFSYVGRVTMLDAGGSTFPSDTTFNLGISTNTDAVSASFSGAQFTSGTTYHLTISYDFSTAVASLTVDGIGTVTAADTFTPATSLDRFAFRLSSTAAGDAVIDNLTVAAPEPSTLAALAIGSGFLFLRRRSPRRAF